MSAPLFGLHWSLSLCPPEHCRAEHLNLFWSFLSKLKKIIGKSKVRLPKDDDTVSMAAFGGAVVPVPTNIRVTLLNSTKIVVFIQS